MGRAVVLLWGGGGACPDERSESGIALLYG